MGLESLGGYQGQAPRHHDQNQERNPEHRGGGAHQILVSASPALELRGIVKSFGDLRANDNVDLVIEWGQVHALLGENGAGKTTLMNVVYGLVRADSGEIVYDGTPAAIHGPTDAIRLGIGMVHQHFMLIPPLTVAENIILGHETVGPADTVDLQEAGRKVTALATRYGLEDATTARVPDLPVASQQRVEILKT